MTRTTGCRLDAFVQVVACVAFFTAAMAVGGGLYGSSLVDVDGARRAERGQRLVSDAMEAIAAYPFDRVHGLDGKRLHENGSAAFSDFSLEFNVTPAGHDILRIRAILKDNRTSREVSRFVTYRGRT